jgi:hypothetical protein
MLELLEKPVDVTDETKRALIEQDMQLWRNTRYQCEIRRRVQQRIGNTEGEAAMIAELERCEKALDVLAEELAAI